MMGDKPQNAIRRALKRDIGLIGNFAFGYADVGSTFYFTLGLVAIYANGATPIALAIAAIPYLLVALTYAELSSSMPESGGALLFVSKGIGQSIGFLAAWSLIIDYIVTMAYGALGAIGYLGFFLPILHEPSFFGIAAFILLLVLISVNIIGIKESSRLTFTLVFTDIIGVIIILVLGYIYVYNPSTNIIKWGTEPTWNNFSYGITIAMASYLGIEVISQTAGETKVPGKNIPRAVILISFVAIFFAIALSTLAVGMISWQELSASFKNPIVALATHLPFGSILAYYFAFMGFSILASTVNSGIVGISRIIFQASKEGLLPSTLSKTSRRFRTPYVSIIIFSLISLILALSGQMETIAQLYNFGALLAYTLVCISLVTLRIKLPQLYRPFKLPFSKKITYRNTVKEISILGILAIIITGGMWVAVVFLHTLGAIVGSTWMCIGVILYIIQKRRLQVGRK